MKNLIVIFLFLLTAATLAYGKWHYDNKLEKNHLKAVAAFKQEQQQEAQEQKEKMASMKKNKSNSVLDWLKYKSNQEGEVKISVFRSGVTEGTGSSSLDKHWTGLLENYLNSQEDIASVSLIDNSFGGYTTQRLVNEDKIKDVLEDKPDLVMIEPTIINNYVKNVSIDQTNKDVLSFVKRIKKKLPKTLIVIQSTNPTDIKKFPKGKNKLGYRYKDYATELKTFSKEKDLNFVDIYSGIDKLKKQNKKNLKDILSDDRHPNDLGYKYWFETLRTSFEKTKLVTD
ncbi:SGNH/GDSL hydrolase family protein [Neobacillus cucumis]|uniref:SGNH/GDSL hydrolase family protein n=1 Tax=Neobacillus cucumis TaxID=1740721 RepID=UPI0018E04C58|nr:SGNH/GDSL hydrolase family protein [Neobacillus cucumis]MBI0577934.1 SGNH/GDSL hydrolase family protein [Neobacillus cucumis]